MSMSLNVLQPVQQVNTDQNQVSPARLRQSVTIPIQQNEGTFHTFHNLKDRHEHLAITFGDWKGQAAPLVRLHSECLTGDIFHSGKCDCGDQLQEAIARLQREGGVLLYLRQEGRGIGLYNKLDSYELQSKGLDTYQANQALGFEDDLRDYTVAVQMLKALGIESIRLLSNNPEKQTQLERLGIGVKERVSTGAFLKESNRAYLAAKVSKTFHSIRIDQE